RPMGAAAVVRRGQCRCVDCVARIRHAGCASRVVDRVHLYREPRSLCAARLATERNRRTCTRRFTSRAGIRRVEAGIDGPFGRTVRVGSYAARRRMNGRSNGHIAFARLVSSAVTSQILISATSFAVGLVLIRWTSSAEYAYYILATNAILLATSLQNAFFNPP